MLVPWKLVFRYPDMKAGQVVEIYVESAHLFRGKRLVVNEPEKFTLKRLRIGLLDQLSSDLPCEKISSVDVSFDLAGRHVWHWITVQNTGDQTASFLAELHGHVTVDSETDLVDQRYEMRSDLTGLEA